MTVYDAVSAHAELLKALGQSGIAVEDVKHLELYSKFHAMLAAGDKTTYIVAVLRDRYAVSERTIWRVVRKFRRVVSVY